MIPATSLQVLLEHAREQADAAAATMRQLKQHWQQAQDKHQGLVQYLQDYRQRLTHTAQAGISAQALREYYQFIAKLELAVRLQGEEAARAGGQWEMAQRAWQDAMARVNAYEQLQVRQQAQQLRVENRREQKEQDERAGRAGRGPFS